MGKICRWGMERGEGSLLASPAIHPWRFFFPDFLFVFSRPFICIFILLNLSIFFFLVSTICCFDIIHWRIHMVCKECEMSRRSLDDNTDELPKILSLVREIIVKINDFFFCSPAMTFTEMLRLIKLLNHHIKVLPSIMLCFLYLFKKIACHWHKSLFENEVDIKVISSFQLRNHY